MVTKADKKLAESMRNLGRVAFDLANEIDPPYPCGPLEPGATCVGAGGWPPFTDHGGFFHPGCEETCSAYLKWKLKNPCKE